MTDEQSEITSLLERFQQAWLDYQRTGDSMNADAVLRGMCFEHVGELLSYALDMTQAVELLICRTCDTESIEQQRCCGGGAFSCPVGMRKLSEIQREAKSFRQPMSGGWVAGYDWGVCGDD